MLYFLIFRSSHSRFSALQGLEISIVVNTWVIIRDSIKASAGKKVGILENVEMYPSLIRNVQK